MIYLWALLGSVMAVGCEIVFLKTSSLSYTAIFPWVCLPALGINFAIFQLVRNTGSILTAVIVFSFTNILLRVGYAIYAGERVSLGSWLAVILICIAQLVRHWR